MADPYDTDRHRELIEQISTLWPHLNFAERLDWLLRVKPIFGGNHLEAYHALSGEPYE